MAVQILSIPSAFASLGIVAGCLLVIVRLIIPSSALHTEISLQFGEIESFFRVSVQLLQRQDTL